MSLSDDEELDARLGALRADPPERGFSSRLRGALEAEAAAMGEVPPGEADLSHLDARLSALKVEPPDTGFGARLHTALERAKEEREPVFPYLQSWLVRAAIVLLAIFAPVAVYAAGVRLVQAIRATTSEAPAAPPPTPSAPVERAPRPVHRERRPAMETPPVNAAPPTIAEPPRIERLAPTRERLHEAPSIEAPARPEGPAAMPEAAPTETPAAAPAPAPAPIERLRVDLRAPHREGDVRPAPREVGERPPSQGGRDGHPPGARDGHRPGESTTTAPPPRDSLHTPPPDRLPPRDRPLPAPGDCPMVPPDRPPPMERPAPLR